MPLMETFRVIMLIIAHVWYAILSTKILAQIGLVPLGVVLDFENVPPALCKESVVCVAVSDIIKHFFWHYIIFLGHDFHVLCR